MEHCDNIGARGAQRRRTLGKIGLTLAILGGVALLAGHAPRPARLLLALPIAMAATGFLQARERT